MANEKVKDKIKHKIKELKEKKKKIVVGDPKIPGVKKLKHDKKKIKQEGVGPRGGQFKVTESGKKEYVKKSEIKKLVEEVMNDNKFIKFVEDFKKGSSEVVGEGSKEKASKKKLRSKIDATQEDDVNDRPKEKNNMHNKKEKDQEATTEKMATFKKDEKVKRQDGPLTPLTKAKKGIDKKDIVKLTQKKNEVDPMQKASEGDNMKREDVIETIMKSLDSEKEYSKEELTEIVTKAVTSASVVTQNVVQDADNLDAPSIQNSKSVNELEQERSEMKSNEPVVASGNNVEVDNQGGKVAEIKLEEGLFGDYRLGSTLEQSANGNVINNLKSPSMDYVERSKVSKNQKMTKEELEKLK